MGGRGSQQWVQQQVLLKQAPVQKPHDRHRLGLGSSVSCLCAYALAFYVLVYPTLELIGIVEGLMTWDADS